jgi:hypothetical protein
MVSLLSVLSNELTCQEGLLYAVEELGRVVLQIHYYRLDLYGTCQEHINALHGQVAAVREILSALVSVLRDQEDADNEETGGAEVAESNEEADSQEE